MFQFVRDFEVVSLCFSPSTKLFHLSKGPRNKYWQSAFYCVRPQMTHYRTCIDGIGRVNREIYNFNPRWQSAKTLETDTSLNPRYCLLYLPYAAYFTSWKVSTSRNIVLWHKSPVDLLNSYRQGQSFLGTNHATTEWIFIIRTYIIVGT